MQLEEWVGGAALVVLMAYAVFAGADFGGGVWDMLATGPRREQHRAAIAKAMGPVWEANHVWLIFLIVLLFSCFPSAFSALSVALFVPFHLVLVGIILRGSAFVFRAHGAALAAGGRVIGRLFGAASVITPVLLGMCLGAVSSGHIQVRNGLVISSQEAGWTSPFALSVGILTLAVCAYLAAVFLILESEGQVQEDFRRRALATGAVMAALAALTLVVARVEARWLWSELMHRDSAPIIGLGVILFLLSSRAVFRRRYSLGRIAAVGQVVTLLLGWAVAQQPYIIYPDVTLMNAAAPAATLRFVLWTLVPGGLLLLPSLWFLFTVFKGVNPAAPSPPGVREMPEDTSPLTH
jgi:cytochrome d ubiquinol oxidase subunit II